MFVSQSDQFEKFGKDINKEENKYMTNSKNLPELVPITEIKRSLERKIPKGPFEFSPELIKRMEGEIENSNKKNVEIGFNLCRKPKSKELINGDICEGTKCSVLIGKKDITGCPKGHTFVGTFHTHPHERGIPSMKDLELAYESAISCIGGINNGKKEIKSYERKDLFDQKILSELNEGVNEEQKLLETIKEFHKRTDDTIKKFFKETKIL